MAAPELKVKEIAAPFPRTTFTSWGARYQSTIDERKHALAQVRETSGPSWPRSWANFSLL